MIPLQGAALNAPSPRTRSVTRLHARVQVPAPDILHRLPALPGSLLEEYDLDIGEGRDLMEELFGEELGNSGGGH